LVLVTGAVLSVLVFVINREALESRERVLFEDATDALQRELQRDVESHVNALRSARDFLLAVPEADRDAFDVFAKATMQRAAGLEVLQWIPNGTVTINSTDPAESIPASGPGPLQLAT